MGIRVLAAVARGGKTAWAVTQARHRAAGLVKSPYVLLPSRTQVDDFKQRLANQGGAMGVYLGTFRDLCQEILDRSEINLIVLSETAQIKLLQSIVENLPLNYFQKIIHKPGFAQALLAIAKELEAGMIGPDSFQAAVQKMNREGLLRFIGKQLRLARKVYTCYNRAERDRLPERQLEGQERGRRSTPAPSVTTFTASSPRWG